jgi:subtilase family serine protease
LRRRPQRVSGCGAPTSTGNSGWSIPALLPGDEVEVTALWDVRDRFGEYVITVTADAFSQIEELRKDNNSGSVHVAVRGTRVDPV